MKAEKRVEKWKWRGREQSERWKDRYVGEEEVSLGNLLSNLSRNVSRNTQKHTF